MQDFIITGPKQNQNTSLIQDVVRVKLTQSLNLVTNDLVEETTLSLHDILGESDEWHTIELRKAVTDIVARLSSRVFLGKELCRNERWLEIAKTYTIDWFTASFVLRMVPWVLRPLGRWLMPQCISLRKSIKDAHQLIDPEVLRRKTAVDEAIAAGQELPKVSDTIGWMYEIMRGHNADYDFVAGQLSLTMAAIHTTSEVTTQAMLDFCEFPELAQQLRQEAMPVLGEHGWTKTSLHKLKLMDSFLKESQRVQPLVPSNIASVPILSWNSY